MKNVGNNMHFLAVGVRDSRRHSLLVQQWSFWMQLVAATV